MFDDTTIPPRLARYVWGLYRFIHPQFLARENDDYDQLIRDSRFHSSQSMWTKGGIYLEDSKSIRRIPSIRVYSAIYMRLYIYTHIIQSHKLQIEDGDNDGVHPCISQLSGMINRRDSVRYNTSFIIFGVG